MEKDIKDILTKLMFETCRDQMEEPRVYNGADAGEKLRQCLAKFYKLMRHQNEYYEGLSETQLDDVING